MLRSFSLLLAAALLLAVCSAARFTAHQSPSTRQLLASPGIAAMQEVQRKFCKSEYPKAVPNGVKSKFGTFEIFVYGKTGNKTDIVSEHVLRGAPWEYTEVKHILTAMASAPDEKSAQDPLFVDIGANIGWFTLNVASKGYKVYAFEGMPENQALLRNSICANPGFSDKVTLFATGLSNQTGSCYLFAGTINMGDGITMCGVSSEAEAQKKVPPEYELRGTMTMSRLDDLLDDSVFVKVLKMDVEGWERYVVMGGEKLFSSRRVQHIVMEMSGPLWTGNGAETDAMTKFMRKMQSHGYRISLYGFNGPWMDSKQVEAAGNRPNESFNIYLVLDDSVSDAIIVEGRAAQTKFCAARPAAPKDSQTATVGPLKMHIYKPDTDNVSQTLTSRSSWQQFEVNQVLAEMARPSPPSHTAAGPALFVDVGANLGWYSLAVAAKGYQVIAFEAMNSNVELLRATLCDNAALSERVTLIGAGLSNRSENCFVYSPVKNQGNGMVLCGVAKESEVQSRLKAGVEVARGPVTLHRLDAIINRPIKVLKIDTEGWDAMVLSGAQRLLAKGWVETVIAQVHGPRVSQLQGPGAIVTMLMHLQHFGFRISLTSFSGPWLTPDEINTAGTGHKHLFTIYASLAPPSPPSRPTSSEGGGSSLKTGAAILGFLLVLLCFYWYRRATAPRPHLFRR